MERSKHWPGREELKENARKGILDDRTVESALPYDLFGVEPPTETQANEPTSVKPKRAGSRRAKRTA